MEQHETLLNSFAKVGIVALIDEATGYQQEREKDELRVLTRTHVLLERAKNLISEVDKDKFIEHLKESYCSKKELIENKKQIEEVRYLDKNYQTQSFEEFMKDYQADENLNYSDLEHIGVGDGKVFGPCTSPFCSCSNQELRQQLLEKERELEQSERDLEETEEENDFLTRKAFQKSEEKKKSRLLSLLARRNVFHRLFKAEGKIYKLEKDLERKKNERDEYQNKYDGAEEELSQKNEIIRSNLREIKEKEELVRDRYNQLRNEREQREAQLRQEQMERERQERERIQREENERKQREYEERQRQ
ncbi:hypothetical protein C1645_841084 [Glomus cerebriforme]|uniref:Uncharacterized protein n=1 Tax=Glomus cerebriforme TaxID=658196 RepID=A0A397S175_9GLOM|nr:hypothetical protein C1645_841084 [Glomus cerebriforme]